MAQGISLKGFCRVRVFLSMKAEVNRCRGKKRCDCRDVWLRRRIVNEIACPSPQALGSGLKRSCGVWADRAYLEMGVLPDLERRANTGFSGRGLPPFCGARPILSLNYRHLPAAVPGDFWGIARPLQNGCKRRWEGGGIQRTAR
jgi:hypothetical protein